MEELKELLIGFGQRMIDFEQRLNEKFREIDEKFEQVVIELENNAEKIDRVERELKAEMAQVKEELKGDMKQLERIILDKQFLFETEYGKKIDMMYDAVLLELDKNKEKSEKIHKFDARMERSEIKVFNHEKRIWVLERS